MENSADEVMRKKLVVIGAGFVLFVVVIILVWILSNIPHHTANVDTVNADDVVSGTELSDKNLADLERELREFLGRYYSDKNELSGKLTMTVRSETVVVDENKVANFIVDVEELRLSYRVMMNLGIENSATFWCAELNEMKYKDTLCVGYEGISTIESVFGAALPIRGAYVEQMGMALEDRAIDTKEKNYKMGWEMRGSTIERGENENPDGSARPYLIITAETCGEDEKYIEAAKDYVDTFIKEAGAEKADGGYDGVTSEIFNYRVECKNG